MQLTILQAGDVPAALAGRFAPYSKMFERMFAGAGKDFSYRVVRVFAGEPLPAPDSPEAVLITGSAAGVYEDHDWLPPLRAFIRGAYAARTPMAGVCFGHQVMADALGGTVVKSEKGWGLGRHSYGVQGRSAELPGGLATVAVACSHQDQVIVPPPDADIFLASEFTPNAGLVYRNGAAISVQPHPEFADDYATALAELRRGRAPDTVVDAAVASMATSSDAPVVARVLGDFLERRAG